MAVCTELSGKAERALETLEAGFPNEESAWRLLGALLAEQLEVWSTGRRWMRREAFLDWKRKRDGAPLDRAA